MKVKILIQYLKGLYGDLDVEIADEKDRTFDILGIDTKYIKETNSVYLNIKNVFK